MIYQKINKDNSYSTHLLEFKPQAYNEIIIMLLAIISIKELLLLQNNLLYLIAYYIVQYENIRMTNIFPACDCKE